MYAIVIIAGQQFKVSKDQTLFVHRLEGKEGDSIKFEDILLADNGGQISIGTPTLSGSVSAKIISHVKGDKVIIFKKKRRKGYKRKNGHRQYFTKILIENISI